MKKIIDLENVRLPILMLALIFIISCKDDDPNPVNRVEDPIAAFTPDVDELTVTFNNTSKNATSFSWDFGDDKGKSEEKSPKYTYAAAGKYEVVLTAKNDAGTSNVAKVTLNLASKDEKLALLSGETSKTWKLLRDPVKVSMLLAADQNLSQIYWAGSKNDGGRPCLYDDEFIFSADGNFEFKDNDTFWAEFGVFNNIQDCDSDTKTESCFTPTADNMVNECGDDISAWRSKTHKYTYDPDNNKITLSGEGAWIGIPKLATTEEVTTPQSEVTFDAVFEDGGTSGVDTMFASFTYASSFWTFTYVSYDDPSKEPAIVSLGAQFSFDAQKLEVTFKDETTGGATSWNWDFGDNKGTSTEQNPVYTYGAEGTYQVTLEVSDGSSSATVTREVIVQSNIPAPTTLGHTFADAAGGDLLTLLKGTSTIELGVDDPADANASKVGKFTRVAGSDYQEAQITADPQSKFSLENVTSMTLDIYLPSSNDYSTTLTQALVIGFGDQLTSPGGEWWQSQSQWSSENLALDQWQTLTFDLKAATQGNGANDATSRKDLDMFFLGIGGTNHGAGGVFYIRNLSLK